MPPINWDIFAQLPGDTRRNFEILCRTFIRRLYGQYGDFRALANQPGVEFHLNLFAPCDLGAAGRWFGWQCRWYDLPSGHKLAHARRKKIRDAITKTESLLPGLTDWILCTRFPLTKGDQEWFFGLNTRMRLALWSSDDIDGYLTGSAEILRSTFFGELILTPDALAELHTNAVARIEGRWLPDVHQVLDAERDILRSLGIARAWSNLTSLEGRLKTGAEELHVALSSIPERLRKSGESFAAFALTVAESLSQVTASLARADFAVLRQELTNHIRPSKVQQAFPRTLRAARQECALSVANLFADMHGAHIALSELGAALERRVLAVVAEAGNGKTQLSAHVTAPRTNSPSGILIHGRDLQARQNLDDLAGRVTISGKPVQSFEALVAAVDAAGQRSSCRLPIVIDGLNESEDPRDWKSSLASIPTMLEQYPYVLLICTLRPEFLSDAIPHRTEYVHIKGFDRDLAAAARRYFEYYLIDPSDADFPWQLLNHPLTLRLFCEVTNPTRETKVGIEAMPISLTGLFERYLNQVATRISALAGQAWRYYEHDIRSALNVIGMTLWTSRTRSIDKEALRQLLNDNSRPWDQSIIRAMEHDGILIRVSDYGAGAGRVAVIHDSVAGHIVADALLDNNEGDAFDALIAQESTKILFSMDYDKRHPLAGDILRGFVGLLPRRRYCRHLWPLLEEPLKTQALVASAELEAHYLDGDTISELAKVVTRSPLQAHAVFDRLWITRAARSHPLDAEFLDSTLRSMSLRDRDLRWTEWLRRNESEIVSDLLQLEERWKHVNSGLVSEKNRARWVMWNLTSTVRLLRDYATRALSRFGSKDPSALFALTLDSLAVNDPYVPERMLAACYGVAMSLWADPQGDALRAALPDFADAIVDLIFVPNAPHSTCHVLIRDSALGVITVARRLTPDCIAKGKTRYLTPPFDHMPSPFLDPTEIVDENIADAKSAIRMDFGNYTIGRLVPDRHNYDDTHPTFREIRRQIEARIIDLGFNSSEFERAERDLSESAWRGRAYDKHRVDRYGKKYSWIAYFEMYGLRQSQGMLTDFRLLERVSDVDIDPSFPQQASAWLPTIQDFFTKAPVDPPVWISDGGTPDYQHLLNPPDVDGQSGPWSLLEGFIEESSPTDDREVFTFLRGVLVDENRANDLLSAFATQRYPGNDAIPAPASDYYVYAGEIPWSRRFGADLRNENGNLLDEEQEAFCNVNDNGVPVEIPVVRFSWERYHSELNQVSNIIVPSPALCGHLELVNHQGKWDFFERSGELATVYRELGSKQSRFVGQLAYIRSDLLATYLSERGKVLIWLLWGERGLHYRPEVKRSQQLSNLYAEYAHIHKFSRLSS